MLGKKIALWIYMFIQGHLLRTMVGMGVGSIGNNHKSSGDNPDAEGNNPTSNLKVNSRASPSVYGLDCRD